jgi:hypothetical protein
MDEPRITVTPKEFQSALTVWLRLAPKSIERRYVKWLELKAQKRDLEHHRVDLAAEFAAIAMAGMIRAGWEVTRLEGENIFRDLVPGERERLGQP